MSKEKNNKKTTEEQNINEEKKQAEEVKQEDSIQEESIKEEDSQQKTEQQEENKKEKSAKDKKEEKKEKQKKKEEKTEGEKLQELQDKYLRLNAEYDNYRKRTLKEKMELSKTAGEDVLQSLLPVMDDFERALQSIDESEDIEAVKEGIHLIYSKFNEVLQQNGLKPIEAKDNEFDTDKHEAISKIPAPSEDMKGKVVDVIQRGYYLNDKVLRFSKVVIGE